MRQHVTAIEAACAIGSGGACEGVSVGSTKIVFRPGSVRGGEYRFAVGTAGSTGLVLQTVLIPLLMADTPSRLVLEGGTHNMMAPPFEFIAKPFLPVINRMGPRVEARLVRHGFYPGGGGQIEVDIAPAPLVAIDCVERGSLLRTSAIAFIAGLPFDIAEREIACARKLINWPERSFAVRELPEERGPGNILLLEAEYEHVTEVVSGFGQLGVPPNGSPSAPRADERLSGIYRLCWSVLGRPAAPSVRIYGRRHLHRGQARPACTDGCWRHRVLHGPTLPLRALAGGDT